MAIGYGVAAPKPVKGQSRRTRKTQRDKLGKQMRDAVWLRTGGICEVCGAGPLDRTTDVLSPRAGHVAHLRGRRVAPADRFNPDKCELRCRDCHLGLQHSMRFA
jgi:5-methylcytosine-specific restriction endonuclease McrA